MLAKKFRLSGKQIGFIHKKGRRLSFDKISIKFAPNRVGFPRYAVNVPVKVYKKAVTRNRVRRIIYEEIGRMNLAGSQDFLINIYGPDSEENFRQKIQTSLKKIHV